MFSFLSPYRDALLGAALAFLLTAGVAFWIHHNHIQQDIGEAKVIAADKAAAAKQAAADKERIDVASRSLATLQAQLDVALAAPVVHDTVRTIRVCDNAAPPAASPVREDAAAGARSVGAVQPTAVVEEPPQAVGADITDITESEFAHAGALIAYLQGYILACQNAGFCQKEVP